MVVRCMVQRLAFWPYFYFSSRPNDFTCLSVECGWLLMICSAKRILMVRSSVNPELSISTRVWRSSQTSNAHRTIFIGVWKAHFVFAERHAIKNVTLYFGALVWRHALKHAMNRAKKKLLGARTKQSRYLFVSLWRNVIVFTPFMVLLPPVDR